VRVIALGGLEQVGINMMLFEFGDDIIIVDMGLQFPDEGMHGIDYIIPDISYLKGKEKNIRGVIITHAHYDHIGAIPHIMQQLQGGDRIPLYGSKLTIAFIRRRQEEYQGTINLKEVDPEKDKLRLGAFEVEFFRVNHNIPDSMGVIIHSPIGTFVHTGDWKFDHSPIEWEKPFDVHALSRAAQKGVLAVFSDSTNANRPGYQLSEADIGKELDRVFRDATGRILTGTFASLLSRVQQIIWLSEKYGRKVVLAGRSIISNIDVAHQLGYLKYKPGTIIEPQQMKKYADHELTIVCTGAQGEKRAALMRIASGEHKDISTKPNDTVIFSSSVVPGNENTVQRLMDLFYRAKAHVIHYQMMDVHAGGHATQEDIKMLIRLVNAKYYVPIEGNHFLLVNNVQIAEQSGIPKENIFLADNGQVMEFTKDHGRLTEEYVPTNLVTVDGTSVGEVGGVVLRDREMMAEGGIFVIILHLHKDKSVIGNPDIISRGFIYMKEAETLMNKVRDLAKKSYTESRGQLKESEIGELKTAVRKSVEKYLFKETGREPMVLPVFIQD
ncbi:MAG: hypothetical protein A2788_01900, partial [Candidatus Abawacabacteria bacterium RIFCSPHIGHO2_01_FULL_46_8]